MKKRDVIGHKIVAIGQRRTNNIGLQPVWDVQWIRLDNGVVLVPSVHELEDDYAVEMVAIRKGGD